MNSSSKLGKLCLRHLGGVRYMARHRQWVNRGKFKVVRPALTQEHLNREHDMRMWRETLVLVDELNENTTLAKHALPVILLSNFDDVGLKGQLAWVHMDNVFDDFINPGKAVFATQENVEYHCAPDYIRFLEQKEKLGDGVQQAYDSDLRSIFESSVLECEAPLTKAKIMSYCDSLDVHVPEGSIDLKQDVTTPGEHKVLVMINDVASAVLQAKVS